ncbi:MAG TPA: hypothetical protein VIV11_19465 [Kofleriaceae bacterium]
MRRGFALALVLAIAAPSAWAKQEEDEEEEDSGDEEGGDEEEEEDAEPAAKGSAKEEEAEEEEDVSDEVLPPKQNLTGHDMGTNKRENEFERDRFFVDKVDTEKTEEGTLIQGSLASSSFIYKEMGGAYRAPMGADLDAGNVSGPVRLFTDLRLQTDFRHIKASRWDARVDARARLVNTPPNPSPTYTPPNQVQSGLTGNSEFELRELWLIRSGKRSDFFLGRQFVADLGGVKFDGIRLDYAKSAKLTLIGFGGLYPIRGSRSLTTDYPALKTEDGNAAGRFVATGGFGAAYRTISAYGAIGGVTMIPLSRKEQARIYVTSQGYLRSGSKLDFYHFALIDVFGTAASESTGKVQFTNVSAGANYKPNPRLRLTAGAHRVDTETLNVQAGVFLDPLDTSVTGNAIVQNDAYIIRIATDSLRGGVSAGLGKQQRFELSTAITVRRRPALQLLSPDGVVNANLPAAQSVEVWGGFVDRRSIKGTRIGIDGSQTFRVGDLSYQRSEIFTGRLFVNRLIQDGRGEWEAEVQYAKVRDSILQMTGLGCANTNNPDPTMYDVTDCYGTSNNTVISAGGQLFYRLKEDWFGIGTLHVMRISNVRSDQVSDPTVTGITGFVRIAKRF